MPAFLLRRFPIWPKKSEQEVRYLKNKKRFYDERKNIIPHF